MQLNTFLKNIDHHRQFAMVFTIIHIIQPVHNHNVHTGMVITVYAMQKHHGP